MKKITHPFYIGLLFLCSAFVTSAQPVASFIINSPAPVCDPAAISFTNTSSGDGPLSYAWNFGINGATDTVVNPSFIYDTCGIFFVELIVTDTFGQSASDTQQVVINCAPDADFSFIPDFVCDSSNVQFTDASTPADSIISWQWNFGDPSSGALNISSQKNPAHYFDSAGIFVVSLTITSGAGCSAVQTDTIVVYHPQSNFALTDSACVSDSAQFIDLSSSQDSITEWSWNFDDPTGGANVSIKQNPFHIYDVAGIYKVRLTITTENGCVNSLKKAITVYALPDVNAGDDKAICPFDSVQLIASGAVNYSWQPSSLVSNDSLPNPFAFPLSTIDFYVTGTDTNGCSATDTVNVNVLPAPAANAGNDTIICAGTSAVLHGSGGTSFQWSPSNTLDNDTSANPTASPAVTTTYYLTVKDAEACAGFDSVTVTVSPLPVASITGLNDHYCSNGTPVDLSAIPAGGIFSGDGVSNNTFNPSSLAPGGPYFIIYNYTDSIGCTANDTGSVTVLSSPVVVFSTSDSSICLNAAPLSFVLSPESGILSGTGISNNLFDPALSGAGLHPVYYSVTDTAGCSSTDTLEITVFSLPSIIAGTDTAICSGDSIQLHASGGISYSWSPDSSLSNGLVANPFAFPLSTTQYKVTAFDTNQCSNTDSLLITVLSAGNVDAGADVSICKGDTVALFATGGTEYLWSPSEGLSDTTVANPLAFPEETKMYSVTINAGSSCPGVDSVLVTVLPLPVVTASENQSLCTGDSVQLLASGAITYLWQPSTGLNDNQIENPLAFPPITTTYIVSGIDSNGCSNEDSVELTVLSLPFINAGADTSLCNGDTLQLNASGGTSYVWIPENSLSDDSTASPLAFPDINTAYIVTGTDGSGCSNNDTINVFVLSASLLDAGTDTSICKGDSILLNATGGLNFTWSPAAGLSDPLIANPLAFPDTTTVYSVSVSVGTDCIFSDSVKIVVNELPLIDAGTDSSVCPGDSVQLLAIGAISYNWSPENSLSDPNIANPFASPVITTIYHVTGTDVSGCKNKDSVTIIMLPAPDANAGTDTAVCIGDSIMLAASGGTTFSWTPPASLSNAFISNPVAFPTTTTAYIVKVNDGGICFGYDTIIVAVNSLPVANAGEDQVACAGSLIQLNASGGIEYTWSPSTGLSASTLHNPVATVTESITYIVTVTDENRCMASDSVYLEVPPPLMAFVSDDTAVCIGTTVQLAATGGESYTWIPAEILNDPSSANPIASPSETTTFTVIVSDGICYAETLEVTVFVSSPTINAGSDASVTSGEAFQFNATASVGVYTWTPSENLSCTDCLNPIATPQQTVTYTVSVTDSIGCTASDDISVFVGCNEESVFIPNAFTPDKNGHNDVLFVRSTGVINVNFFRIFDRWGKLIFESNDINDGWDGTYKNQVMPPGVYLFTMQASCGNGEVIQKQGNVTLLN